MPVALVIALLCGAASTAVAAPTFTGNVPADFADAATVVIADSNPGRDVGLPLQAPANATSGWDMKATHFFYDGPNDRLYVGIESWGIAGDADGDGDPNSTGAWLAGIGGADQPAFGTGESFAVLFDTDNDGTADFVAGVPAFGDYSDFAVAPFFGSPFVPGFGFGAADPLHTGTLGALPSAGSPHIEFTVENFSQLPGIGPNPAISFGTQSFMGSIADAGIGEDHSPESFVTASVCKFGTCDTEDPDPPGPDPCAGSGFELSVGGNTWDIDPMTGTERVDEFYAYGDGVGASANTGLEKSNTAVLALHRDPDGILSLVMLLDAANDGSGGRLNLTMTDLPASATLAVEDDPSGGQDSYNLATGDFRWRWFSCCTDGVAITDLPDDLCVTLSADLVQGLDTFEVILGDGKATATFPATVGEPITLCAKSAKPDDDCDGVDDDCDGMTDEHFTVTQTTCGTGVCSSLGQLLCITGGELLDTCVVGDGLPTDTLCDDVDNDCDGETDEDYVAPWTFCGYGPCKNAGQLICDRGDLVDTCEPAPILGPDDNCDGIDDNCDGVPDNFCQAIPTTCGVGTCAATGIITCSMGNWLTICRPALPGIELCGNGLDDDCDGLTDEDDTCDCGDTLTTGTAVITSGIIKFPGFFDQDPSHTVIFDLAGGVELEVFADGTAHMQGLVSVVSGGGGPTGPDTDWYLDIYLAESATGGYVVDQDFSSLQMLTPPWSVAYLSGLAGVPIEITTDPLGGLNFDGPLHFDYGGYRDTGSIGGDLAPEGTPGCDF